MSASESTARAWVSAHYRAREREAVARYEAALARLREQRLKLRALTDERAPSHALDAEREVLEAIEAEVDAKGMAVEVVCQERCLALSTLLDEEIAAEQQKAAETEQSLKDTEERIEILCHERAKLAALEAAG